MRRIALLLALLAVPPLGCIESVNPLAIEQDKLIVKDPGLIGTWMCVSPFEREPRSWIRVSAPPDRSTYHVEARASEERRFYSATLVQFGDVRILDVVETKPDYAEPLGIHKFLRLRRSNDSFTLHMVDGRKFREVVKSSEPMLAIDDTGSLEWSTEELQGFFMRHADHVFSNSVVTSFKRFHDDE